MRVGFPKEIVIKKSNKEDKEQKKKDNIEKLKKFFNVSLCAFGMLIILYLLGIFINLLKNNILVELIKNDIVNEVYSMVEVNREYISDTGEGHFVANFNLESDTLPFKNFSTKGSPAGNCEGYNMYEILHFEGNLKEFLGENMKSKNEYNFSELTFSENDIENIYGVEKKEDQKEKLNYFNNFDGTVNLNINYSSIVEQAYGMYKSKNKKIEYDFSDKEFDNKELKNILMDISYLQNNKGYSIYTSYSYYNTNPLDKFKGVVKPYSSGDISYIKQSIDNDKLIEIAIENNISGHSLLAYGYEKINEDNYKVYVKDSNFPLIKKDILTEKDIEVNNDIKNNFYILFTKEILKDEWSYIYQPSINGVEVYGYYNSFVPGTKLSLYSTGI